MTLYVYNGWLVPVRRYHAGDFKPATMDDLPVPRGSWQAHYDAKQRKYNATLLVGIAFTAATFVVVSTVPYFYFYCLLQKTCANVFSICPRLKPVG